MVLSGVFCSFVVSLGRAGSSLFLELRMFSCGGSLLLGWEPAAEDSSNARLVSAALRWSFRWSFSFWRFSLLTSLLVVLARFRFLAPLSATLVFVLLTELADLWLSGRLGAGSVEVGVAALWVIRSEISVALEDAVGAKIDAVGAVLGMLMGDVSVPFVGASVTSGEMVTGVNGSGQYLGAVCRSWSTQVRSFFRCSQFMSQDLCRLPQLAQRVALVLSLSGRSDVS